MFKTFYALVHRMFTPAIKKQTSVCCFISLNPYIYGISNLGIMEKRKEKRKAILLFIYSFN